MNTPSEGAHLNQLRTKVVPQGPFNTHASFTSRARGALIYDVDEREFIPKLNPDPHQGVR
jgi:hypothetical protein